MDVSKRKTLINIQVSVLRLEWIINIPGDVELLLVSPKLEMVHERFPMATLKKSDVR